MQGSFQQFLSAFLADIGLVGIEHEHGSGAIPLDRMRRVWRHDPDVRHPGRGFRDRPRMPPFHHRLHGIECDHYLGGRVLVFGPEVRRLEIPVNADTPANGHPRHGFSASVTRARSLRLKTDRRNSSTLRRHRTARQRPRGGGRCVHGKSVSGLPDHGPTIEGDADRSRPSPSASITSKLYFKLPDIIAGNLLERTNLPDGLASP